MDNSETICESRSQIDSLHNNNVSHKLVNDDESMKFSGDDIESLQNGCNEANRIFDLFYLNRFDEAFEACDRHLSTSIYHLLAKAFLSSMYAMLTLESNEIAKAKEDIERALKFCAKKRKSNSVVDNLSSWIWKPDYAKYTDYEVHAELIYAECQTLMALLTFFGDQHFISLIRGAFRIRAANNAYKFCYEILNSRQNWSTEELRVQFESGVCNGVGLFNLYLSMLPSKILKLLTLAGFGGDRQLAVQLLKRSTEIKNALRYRVTAMSVKTFNLYVEQLGGKGLNESDIEWTEELMKELFRKFPNAVFVLMFSAKFHFMRGEPEKAIEEFNRCIDIQDTWKQIHNICNWDLCWCYATLLEWNNAAKYAKLLRDHSSYSPATNTYQMAVFKMMQMEDEKVDLIDEVNELMKTVPKLKIRYAGKTIPQEKFLVTRALQYVEEPRDPLIALMELFYVWNIYPMLNNSRLTEPFLTRIDNKLKELESDETQTSFDSIACLLLCKGVLFMQLGKYDDSVTTLDAIITSEDKIKRDFYIPPHAALEMSIAYFKSGNYEKCEKWLRKARSNQTKILNEAIFQLRVHNVSRRLKNIEQSESTHF